MTDKNTDPLEGVTLPDPLPEIDWDDLQERIKEKVKKFETKPTHIDMRIIRDSWMNYRPKTPLQYRMAALRAAREAR